MGEDIGILQQQSRFLRGQFNRFRDEHPLRLDRVVEHSRTQVFVHDPLVQRMLVDQRQPFGSFDDDVGVANLHRSKFTVTSAVAHAARVSLRLSQFGL